MKYFFVLWFAAIAAKAISDQWRKRRALGRELLQLPQRRIADVPEQTNVRLRGHLEPAAGSMPLVAPLTARHCMAWRVRVEVLDRTLEGAKPWKMLGIHQDAARAILVDESGRALLDAATEWHLSYDAKGGDGHWNDLTVPAAAGIRELLSNLGVSTEHAGWDRQVRVEEAVCLAGEPVVLAASGRWELDPRAPSGAYRQAGRVLHLEKMTTGRLVVTNDRWVLRHTP